MLLAVWCRLLNSGIFWEPCFFHRFSKTKRLKAGHCFRFFWEVCASRNLQIFQMRKIYKIVEQELTEMFNLKTFKPDLLKIYRYNHAIPQYGFESEEKLKAINALEKEHPGLLLAGNIRDGIGIADRIHQGKTMASEIIN
jgi:protoporphyrinogen/coproporphyrinogen III oxidase